MICRICRGNAEQIFIAKVLNKYDVAYFQCTDCGFIQTEDPYWLNEAYSSAISTLDAGLIWRNNYLSKTIAPILRNHFDTSSRFLDYGGGYGMFVRLMRDEGFDFYRQDTYCENLFAKFFDMKDLPVNTKFELATVFEVFEHFPDPLKDLENIFSYTDTILFTAGLLPAIKISSANDWSNFIPEAGQHVSFYSKKSLEILAEKFNRKLYSNNNSGLHIITSKQLKGNPFNDIKKYQLLRRGLGRLLRMLDESANKKSSHPESLLIKDFNLYKKLFNKHIE